MRSIKDTVMHHVRVPRDVDQVLRMLWARSFEAHEIGSYPTWLVEVVMREWAAAHDPWGLVGGSDGGATSIDPPD